MTFNRQVTHHRVQRHHLQQFEDNCQNDVSLVTYFFLIVHHQLYVFKNNLQSSNSNIRCPLFCDHWNVLVALYPYLKINVNHFEKKNMYITFIIYRTKRCTDFIDTKEILKLERVGFETEFPSAHVEIAVNI